MDPKIYTDLLAQCLLDNIYGSRDMRWLQGGAVPATEDQVTNGSYWPERAHTMIGLKRLKNIEDCFLSVVQDGIEGDLIETGVWRGGATIFMAGLCKAHQQRHRKVYVADSFEGLPPPDPKYKHDAADLHYTNKFLAVSVEEVKSNFQRYDLLDSNVVFVKGFFETSLEPANIGKLSILRMDGDMYSSTIQVLDQLYDNVSVGGYIIIDDYHALHNCRTAVTDFRAKRAILSPIIKIDNEGVYWRKEEDLA